MQKNIYTTSYYLLNQQFVDWVKKPSPESDRYWQDWQQKYPASVPVMQKAEKMLFDLEDFGQSPNGETKTISISDFNQKEASINKVKANIDSIIEKDIEEKGIKIQSRRKLYYSIAASISILLAAAWLFWQNTFTEKHQEIKEPEIVFLEKSTIGGQKLNLVLPDGSEVKLNSLSEIKFPQNFNINPEREVYLKGEAFFDVTKNPERPFIIHTENFKTKVLGTSFNIKSYQVDNNVSIAVSSGSVWVQNQLDTTSEVVLSPSEMLVYEKAEHESRVEEFDYKKILGWKDGFLVFEKATFEDITAGLSRWYGVNFTVNKPVQMQKGFTGTFENESLQNVLKGIAYSLKFKYEILDDKVIIN
ncbi:MAG: hypothetical protein CMO01_16765 [Thalassobius sp.]|nr:hypothetical protein [Thalassovita sp.]